MRLRNDPSTSSVRWSREDLWSINEITRNPRFWIMCCWTVWDVSTSSHINPKSFAHRFGSFLMPSSYGMSSCEKSGKRTCIPPIEFNVEWMELVTTAFTSYTWRKFNFVKHKMTEWKERFHRTYSKFPHRWCNSFVIIIHFKTNIQFAVDDDE